MSLELAAARWLKYEKDCNLVMMERSPRSWYAGQPDVVGITRSRFMLEVEIKRTMSDFRANAKKRHLQNRFSLASEIAQKHEAMAPKQFWFMVPPMLVDKVADELPPFSGLITYHENNRQWATVIKPSPVNKASLKLSLMECAKLMNNAGNQFISLLTENHHRRGLSAHHFDDSCAMDGFFTDERYAEPGYTNFQI